MCTTPEEATAFAPFSGAIEDIANKSARLITVAPGAGPNEGELIFNGHVWNNVWNFAGNSEIGIDDRDVTAYLDTTNEAGFQSSGDYMEASNAILVVEPKPPYPPWDVDKDGDVDFWDLAKVAAHYGEETEPPYPPWDVDKDGDVDFWDLAKVAAHYGEKYE